MPGRCSLSSSCSTGVMPCEASVDTSLVRHTFLKFAAPNSWRLWTYHAQVWMPGDAANSACGSQKVGINGKSAKSKPGSHLSHEAPLNPVCRARSFACRRSATSKPFGKPTFQPYWGKPAVRNDREDRGDVGIIRSPLRASILPDSHSETCRRHRTMSESWSKAENTYSF